MISLIYSNRTEELARELGERVRAQQLADGVLVPVRVIVPSAAVEDYVRLAVARLFGVAGNLEMLRLTTFAGDVLHGVLGGQLASASSIEAMALTLLLDEGFLALPEVAPVRAYLGAGCSRDAHDMRVVQLATRIGRLFEEYTYSRGPMLLQWLESPVLEPTHAETEVWQRHLWNAMFGAGGLARPRGLVALHEAIAAWPAAPPDRGPTIHVFGFAHFAPAFHQLFACVGRDRGVTLYALSPCEGFWEDDEPRDPAPLALWGRAGREQIRALNLAAGFDHEDRFVTPTGPSLLARIQRDILQRTPVCDRLDESTALDGDTSIRVLEHASVRRELEAVASEIWTRLEADSTLRFDDIAVLLPEADAPLYLAHIGSVFASAHDIPHRVVDIPGSPLSGPADLALRILALPFGTFSRRDVLGVVLHPCIADPTASASRARRVAWCDALGIFHGSCHDDHRGTYLERDLFNWDQGLRRLALGAFMAGDASGADEPFELGTESYVPLEVAPSDVRDAAAFGCVVRSLASDVDSLRSRVLPLGEWAALLASVVETYVTASTDAEAEPLSRCLRQVRALRALDIGSRPIPYRIAYELVRSRMLAQPIDRGREGVIVSRLASLRPVPARVVFACGMGEGRFPAAEPEDPLDLRRAKRLPDDVGPRDRDKFAFLEWLLGARDHFYVSYVSREPLTGDPLAPSPVIQDLLHALGRDYVRDPSSLIQRHPLRRWDDRYFPDVFDAAPSSLGAMRIDEAHAEARTVALRRSAEAAGAGVTRANVRARAASGPSWRALAEHLGLLSLSGITKASPRNRSLSIGLLSRFLQWPLQGWARFCVGLEEDEFLNVEALQEEPFGTDPRDVTNVLRHVWLASRASDGPVEAVYDAAVRARTLRGQGPAGLFAEGERHKQLATLVAWTGEVGKLGVGVKEAAKIHRFGGGVDITPSDVDHPALGVDLELPGSDGLPCAVHVDLVGRTLPRTAEAFLTLSRLPPSDPWIEWRAALRAFVDQAVLIAAGAVDPAPYASVLVEGSDTSARTSKVEFEPMSRDEVTAWLGGVVGDLLSGPHDTFLPCEAVFARQKDDPTGDLVPHLEAARTLLRKEGPSALRSAYGPVPHPETYPIADEAVARSQVERLLGAYFAKRKGAP
ncbi:MAG: exodeoxyribonuclease V subunit gamma [Polyangiaceae bacterium]